MVESIFMRVLLKEKVKLEPAFLGKNFRDEVSRRLQLKVEGVCTKHGFIKVGSVEIDKICAGQVELIGLNGNVIFNVSFYADICNPLIGSIIPCKVLNINKFGILAESQGVVEAIIAKNSVSIMSEVDLGKTRIGDDVLVEVVGKKFELNDKKISLIGRIVRDDKQPHVEINQVFEDEEDDDDPDPDPIQEGGADEEDEDDDEEDDDVGKEEEEEEKEAGSVDDASDISSLNDANSEEFNGNFFSDEEDDGEYSVVSDEEVADDASFVDEEEAD